MFSERNLCREYSWIIIKHALLDYWISTFSLTIHGNSCGGSSHPLKIRSFGSSFVDDCVNPKIVGIPPWKSLYLETDLSKKVFTARLNAERERITGGWGSLNLLFWYVDVSTLGILCRLLIWDGRGIFWRDWDSTSAFCLVSADFCWGSR